MTDSWVLYEASSQTDRARLPPAHQEVFAILDLRQEVNSGGFASYFRYWGGDSAPTALAALPKILGPEWANLLIEAVDKFGPAYPSTPDARDRLIDARGLDAQFAELDERFYDLESVSDVDQVLNAYLLEASE